MVNIGINVFLFFLINNLKKCINWNINSKKITSKVLLNVFLYRVNALLPTKLLNIKNF